MFAAISSMVVFLFPQGNRREVYIADAADGVTGSPFFLLMETGDKLLIE